MDIARKIPFRGLMLGHEIDKYSWECHTHEYYEFFYVVRGSVINVINDEIQILKSRTLTCIRPDDAHFFRNNEEKTETLEFFNIPVSIDFMERQFSYCPELKKRIYEWNIPTSTEVKKTEFGVLCGKAFELLEMQNSRRSNDEFKQKHSYLYHSLARQLCACMLQYEAVNKTKIVDWFSNLIIEIEKIPIDELSYEWMLDVAGVSPHHLWKTFNDYLEISPIKYVNKRKMQIAYERVVGGNEKLTDIAFDVGYNNYTHFQREFKSHFNCTPKELRKNNEK